MNALADLPLWASLPAALLLISLLDNLGKGSSGAAVQCMNIMLGLEETKGLEL